MLSPKDLNLQCPTSVSFTTTGQETGKQGFKHLKGIYLEMNIRIYLTQLCEGVS